MRMAAVAAHENAMVQCVFLSNPLTDGINGVPFHVVPLDGIRLHDLLSRFLHLLYGRFLPRVPILVCRGCDLNV